MIKQGMGAQAGELISVMESESMMKRANCWKSLSTHHP